ncbi:MAG: hypothetical protein PHS54_01485 [Clostridia bacterium]|nr:hypothetical protein [Clostridia bacterium]
MKYKVSIIGTGMVGGSLLKYFEDNQFEVKSYDKYKNIGSIDEVLENDYIYICVPTPSTDDFHCDISIVENIIKEINDKKTSRKVIIIKSTITPGTTKKLQEKYPELSIIFNPEFLTEKNADRDTCFPERQIIGCTFESFKDSTDVLLQLPFAPCSEVITSTEAEMIKYLGNSFLALKVIFANQMYDLCEKLNLDYNKIKDIVGKDKRIGTSHLDVIFDEYRGYGIESVSKCFPKDTKAIIKFADDNDVDLELLKTMDKINTKLWNETKK